MIRIEPDGGLCGIVRLAVPPKTNQRLNHVQVQFGGIGIQLQRRSNGFKTFFRLPFPRQYGAQRPMRIEVVRIEPQGLFRVLKRSLDQLHMPLTRNPARLAQQRPGERRVGLRVIGIQADGAFQEPARLDADFAPAGPRENSPCPKDEVIGLHVVRRACP